MYVQTTNVTQEERQGLLNGFLKTELLFSKTDHTQLKLAILDNVARVNDYFGVEQKRGVHIFTSTFPSIYEEVNKICLICDDENQALIDQSFETLLLNNETDSEFFYQDSDSGFSIRTSTTDDDDGNNKGDTSALRDFTSQPEKTIQNPEKNVRKDSSIRNLGSVFRGQGQVQQSK